MGHQLSLLRGLLGRRGVGAGSLGTVPIPSMVNVDRAAAWGRGKASSSPVEPGGRAVATSGQKDASAPQESHVAGRCVHNARLFGLNRSSVSGTTPSWTSAS